jgi:hypothetical protein
MNAVETLRRVGACDGAVEWVEAQGDVAPEDLWQHCARADWLIWLAVRVGLRREVVELLCDCVEPLLADEERPRAAIEAARRCVRGEATARETRDAAAAADAAAFFAAGADARAAYAAASVAAWVADADAAYDARAAAYAAGAAFHDDDLADAARVVRRRIPWRLIRDGIKKVCEE